jgi:hypothetical protein
MGSKYSPSNFRRRKVCRLPLSRFYVIWISVLVCCPVVLCRCAMMLRTAEEGRRERCTWMPGRSVLDRQSGGKEGGTIVLCVADCHTDVAISLDLASGTSNTHRRSRNARKRLQGVVRGSCPLSATLPSTLIGDITGEKSDCKGPGRSRHLTESCSLCVWVCWPHLQVVYVRRPHSRSALNYWLPTDCSAKTANVLI